MGCPDRIAYSGNRNTMTNETSREHRTEIMNFRQSDAYQQPGSQKKRAVESVLTSENHALDIGPYGCNHTLLVALPAASIYPVPQTKRAQRCNPIQLLRRNSEFPKMQITMRFLSKNRKFTGSPGAYNFTHTKGKSRRTQLYLPVQIIIISN